MQSKTAVQDRSPRPLAAKVGNFCGDTGGGARAGDVATITLLNDRRSARIYPVVVEAVNHLKVRSCLIDGEVAAVGTRDLDFAVPRFCECPHVSCYGVWIEL